MSKLPVALFQPRYPQLKAARRTFDIRVHDPETSAYLPSPICPTLALDNGRVVFGDTTVVTPRFERNVISWVQQTDGQFCSAMLHFTADGLSFDGSVFVGTKEADAARYILRGAAQQLVYSTTVAQTHDLADLGKSRLSVEIALGYQWTEDMRLALAVAFDGVDVTPHVRLGLDGTNALVLAVHEAHGVMAKAPAMLANDAVWPRAGSLTFAFDDSTVSGTMHAGALASSPDPRPGLAWKGLARHVPRRVDGTDPGTLRAIKLSLAELATLSADDADALSYSMLLQNMKWTLDADALKEFFGDARPTLSAERTTLIQQDTGFYTNTFAPAYLGYGFSAMRGAGAPRHPLNGDEQKKLKYFLTSGIATDEAFTRQSSGLVVQAFVAACPRLRDYIHDLQNDWATLFFNYVTSTAAMNHTVKRVTASGDMSLCKRYAIVLRALQPSGALAQQYYNMVVLGMLNNLAEHATHDDPEDLSEWLATTIETFIQNYAETPTNPTQEQLRLQAVAQALRDASQTAGNIAALAKAIATAMVSVRGQSFWSRVANAMRAFAEVHPPLALVAKFIPMLVWSAGLASAVVGLQDWKRLSDAERASVTIATLQIVTETIQKTPSILEATTMTLRKIIVWREGLSSPEVLVAAEGAMAQLEMIQPEVTASRGWLARACRTVSNWTEDASGAVLMPESAFAKYFKVDAFPMQFLGVAASVAFVVLSEIQLVQDIHNGASSVQVAFDALAFACNTLVLISAAATFFVPASFLFAAFGALGALLGAVFAFVSMFVPQPKPESPVDQYMREHVRPLVDGLPIPPASDVPLASAWQAVPALA